MGSEFKKRVSVPTILQMEATECGAASLAMVLAYYKLWLPLERLRMECGVNRDGSKAGKIVLASRRLGCEANGYRLKADRLCKKDFPLIIHWEFNHFVVLEGIDEKYAYLNDPASGKRKIPWQEFKTSYTGIALEIRPGSDFKPAGKPYNVTKEIAKKLLADKISMLFIGIISLGMFVAGLATPVFSRIFVDDIITLKHTEWMYNLAIAMLVAIFLLGVLNILRSIVLTNWQQKLTIQDSSRFFWHTLRLPMTFFHQRYAAEVASRVAYNEDIAIILSESAATAVLDLLVAIFFLCMLLYYSVSLTIIGVIFSALNVIVFFWMRQKIVDKNMAIQQNSGKEYGTLMNGLSCIESIKANGNEGDFFSKWSGYHAKVVKGIQQVQYYSMASGLLPAFFSALNTALIITFGGFSIMEGAMTVGMFIAFQNLMGSFQAPVDKLVGLGNSLQNTEIQMRRLDDVMRYPIDSLNYPPEDKKYNFSKKQLSGEIEFRDITFGYSPLDPPLIEHLNIKVKPGQWVALVGASGSGKSTLAKLVTGIYKAWSGDLLIDGKKQEEIPREIITSSISSVDQEVFLFSASISENISLFDPAISQEDIVRAAKDACIHDDILRLRGAYDGEVSEGGKNFSGGQCQRLEIARALVKNPKILVLDEATSALDPMTEKYIMDNIRHRGCTCLIVAHRLSTIKYCDEIIIFDKGKIIERGNHSELMMKKGTYCHLVQDSHDSKQLMEGDADRNG